MLLSKVHDTVKNFNFRLSAGRDIDNLTSYYGSPNALFFYYSVLLVDTGDIIKYGV